MTANGLSEAISALEEAVGPAPEEAEAIECRDISWTCTRCDTLLAYVDRGTKTTIRVKYKDLYFWVGSPAWARMTCRRCGAVNELLDEKQVTDTADATAGAPAESV